VRVWLLVTSTHLLASSVFSSRDASDRATLSGLLPTSIDHRSTTITYPWFSLLVSTSDLSPLCAVSVCKAAEAHMLFSCTVKDTEFVHSYFILSAWDQRWIISESAISHRYQSHLPFQHLIMIKWYCTYCSYFHPPQIRSATSKLGPDFEHPTCR